MRRVLFFIAIFLFTLSSVMGQMIPITLPADGNWPTIVGDSIMIIGPRQNELTEEQRYFNPVYLMTYPGKEHLKAQMIRAGACDCDPTKPNRRIGVFSVAPDKKVSFSQGNLQYLPAINLWKFADTQYEYLGNANKYLKPTFRNWVDLFGWSANNTTAPFGVSTSTNAADYAGEFVDWGTNTICGDAPGTWRTLSADEWEYLLNGRENAAKLMGHAQIKEINGFIFLPDDWHCPNDITFQPGVQQYADQTFTIDQWTRLEQAGAVFLPAAGRRGGTELLNFNEYGNYWSATLLKSDFASYFAFNNAIAYIDDLRETYFGRPVRLVHDTIVPETIPAPCLIVKVNDTLSINMMCVEGGTFQMGATPEMDPDALAHEAPVHSVTLSDYYIGQIEVTQALWKTVMGTNPSTIKDNNRPVNNVSWEDCQVFIEKLNQKTGYSFRLPTEAEWEYAARGGNKSRGYKYAGSDNIDEVAWYKDNSGGKYQPSALKKPNELGIYDMSGNVFEWCQDWYGPYSADAQVNPQGPESGPYHMIRGGGWKHIQSNRVTYRRTTGANLDITSIGLRLVLDDTALTPPEPEYVDLGLSVKWATFNVGATSPEDYGDYFAWGETEPKETYSWATYKWCDGTQNTMTKYNATDGKTILEPEDDAAHVHWGDKWRMPTKEEIQELFTRCTWKTETQNGINGYNVIGPNGNSIFVPTAGWYNEDDFGVGLQGNATYYWTSTLSSSNKIRAYDLVFNDVSGSNDGIIANTRRCGFPIRPVYDDRPTLTVIPTPEDAKVSFLCKGYQAVGHSITVDKGKDVLYQVTNVDAGYLSQGDSIYNLTKDSVLYVTLRPFSDGNWVVVDNSELTKYENYYISRNGGSFAGPYSNWDYYVLPVMAGETYRVRAVAGQLAPVWFAASTAPDLATKTRPKKVSCSDNKGAVAYVADEVTIPEGAKYLIINNGRDWAITVERKVPDPCLVVKVNDTLSINMMCVEGGTFMMGAMEGDTQVYDNEKPAHEVTLTYNYYIAQTEVTQALWKAVMGNNPSTMIGDDLPVNNVLWEEADAFVKRLSQMTGYTFHLPTEAEWEFAARGGKKSKGYLYAGSDDVDEVAWYADNSGGTTHAVGTKKPNELGIYDMSGNAWEWGSDWLAPYSAETQVNPIGPATGEYHVYHGGGWNHGQRYARSSHRRTTTEGYIKSALGLRVAIREKIEPEAVDLGLSVKWANFNVGAFHPTHCGDYFAWGETEPKETYSWATYKWCDGTQNTMTKYNATDGKTILEPEDDAAHVHWGDKWRMPTKEELTELRLSCTWEWITINGITGNKVTGPNGNSIFLPAGGSYNTFDDQLNSVGIHGWIYSSTKSSANNQAQEMGTTASGAAQTSCSRCVGLTIRPVYDDRP